MNRLIFITVIISVAEPTSVERLHIKHYRPDYEYNPETDAFYKFHAESVSNPIAKDTCVEEGANLMQTSLGDLAQAHAMLKQFPDLDGYAWVENDGKQYEAAELPQTLSNLQSILSYQDAIESTRIPISQRTARCNVVTRAADVQTLRCFYSLPFICKVDRIDVPYDQHCKVHSKEYKYYETVGSCYKFSRVAYSWDQAYDECLAEGAHLIILSSEAEHQLIYNLTQTVQPVAAQTPWSWYAGIRAKKSVNGSAVVFKTIFGQTLEEAGFAEWSENEPNNAGNNEYCGSIFKNDGKYNDLQCSHLYAFICEKEISNEV